MYFFGSLGTLAFLGGFVISMWISIDKLVYGHPIGDRPLLLLGVMLIPGWRADVHNRIDWSIDSHSAHGAYGYVSSHRGPRKWL